MLAMPAAAEGQQASVNVYARVVARIETQELVSGRGSEGAVSEMPASWAWEVRGPAEDGKPWSAPLLASGRGGQDWRPVSGAGAVEPVSYLFAPL